MRLALAILLLLSPAAVAEEVTVIRAGKLFDGKNAPRENAVIVVRGPKVAEVGADVPIPENARIIDLSGMTVMPGLIDAHTHVALHAGDYDAQILRETPEFRAIWATVNARATLRAGVTTIRDLGNEGAGFADTALRDAIARGLVDGPRVVAAIRPVTTTGGYRLTGYSPYASVPSIASIGDGPAELRREVRRLVEQGADVIKIYMESYEKRQPRSDLLSGAMNYAPDEVSAIVEEAHRSGVRVAAHTYSDPAAKMAVAAGVDSIEHGLYLSEETFRAMAAKGIAYVPTLLVYEFWRDGTIFGPISDATRARLTRTVDEHTATFRRALATPVRIVFGSDTFELPGTNAQEIELMVRYGMRPIDALRSATSSAAQLLGVDGVTGSIEAGKSADIIGVSGDPFADIAALRRVEFVMREGRVIER